MTPVQRAEAFLRGLMELLASHGASTLEDGDYASSLPSVELPGVMVEINHATASECVGTAWWSDPPGPRVSQRVEVHR